MNIVDSLTTIIVVTILVSVALVLVVYLNRRVNRARGRVRDDESVGGSRYFVRYAPPDENDGGADSR